MITNARFWFFLAQIGFFSLFALLMLLPTILVPPQQYPIGLILILTVTPLLLPMRGFLKGLKKNCAWMGYISLIYFIHGTVECYSTTNINERIYSGLEITSSLLLFFGTTLYIRFQKDSI